MCDIMALDERGRVTMIFRSIRDFREAGISAAIQVLYTIRAQRESKMSPKLKDPIRTDTLLSKLVHSPWD